MDAATHSRNLLSAMQRRDAEAAGIAIAGLLEQPPTPKHNELAQLMFVLLSSNTKWAQVAALQWVTALPGAAVVMAGVNEAIGRLQQGRGLNEQ